MDRATALELERRAQGSETPPSAVSWGAILGGAVAAAALSLIFLALGSGLGLSSISPWAYEGASATTLGVSAVVWLSSWPRSHQVSVAISPVDCAPNGATSMPTRPSFAIRRMASWRGA